MRSWTSRSVTNAGRYPSTAMTEPEHTACDSPESVWCQPTLNTPFEPPERHWKTIHDRTRNEITPVRRKVRSRMPLSRASEPTQTDLYTGDSEVCVRIIIDGGDVLTAIRAVP